MEISFAEIKNVSDIFELPCFEFRIGNGNGNTDQEKWYREYFKEVFRISYQPIARAIIGFADSLRKNPNVKDEIRKNQKLVVPKTIFSFNSFPRAYTTLESPGTIIINFGFFYNLIMMPHTMRHMKEFLEYAKNNRNTTIKITDMPVSINATAEIYNVMRNWYNIYCAGRFRVDEFIYYSREESFEKNFEVFEKNFQKISFSLDQILTFVTFHELSHWYKAVCLPGSWNSLESSALDSIVSWLFSDWITNEDQRHIVGLFKKDKSKVLDNWVNEVMADIMAHDNLLPYYCFHYHDYYYGNEQRLRELKAEIYIAQALTFSLLFRMVEIFHEVVLDKPLPWEIQPPARLRQDILCYTLAKEKGLSKMDFFTKEWGAGYYATWYMERELGCLQQFVQSNWMIPLVPMPYQMLCNDT